MSQNLTKRVKNHALYLPALDPGYTELSVSRQRRRGLKVRPKDLNFQNKISRLFKYRWALASAGRFAGRTRLNSVTGRDPKTSWILGDSGGFQLATGSLLMPRSGRGQLPTGREALNWCLSDHGKAELLRWTENNCDYGMTLDLPLWSRTPGGRPSPFQGFSVEELTDLTIANLHFIDENRGRYGHCKFLNVLQGETLAEEDNWFSRVKLFPFEGWAWGPDMKRPDSLVRVLRRLLLLRDEGMLAGGSRDWFHLLGLSRLCWAPLLTAAQLGVQNSTQSRFTISYDSSTPLLWAGRFQQFARRRELTADLSSWTVESVPFPVGYAAANQHASDPFPPGSPISRFLTVGDMNPKSSPFAAYTFDQFSTAALANHNIYVFIDAILDANEAAFERHLMPQEIADAVGIIGDLFTCERWGGLLAENVPVLQRATGPAPTFKKGPTGKSQRKESLRRRAPRKRQAP